MAGRHVVRWQDAGREPMCAPNPKHPSGIDVDASGGSDRACTIELSYPARRCGHYLIRCKVCGASAACTTAGRADDPRSIKIACKDAIQ